MFRGWRPPPFQNSNSEHLEALKCRQGRWLVTWPLFRALLGVHNPSAGPIDRDFGGSGTSAGPIDRDFPSLGELLGAQIRAAGPMDRDFLAWGELLGGHNRSAGPMHHDFLVSGELLGHQNPLAGLMDRDFGGAFWNPESLAGLFF